MTTWVLVLVFLAGPLEGRIFYYKPDGKNPQIFARLADRAAVADDLGPAPEREFKLGDQSELKRPFTLKCIRQGSAT